MPTHVKASRRKTNDFSMLDVESQEDLLATLAKGGLILFPTDTIWGIGCDATNPDAVEKIFDLKQRNKDKPFVVIVDSIKMLKDYVEQVHPKVETLLQFHQRPLTVIYQEAKNIAINAIAADGSVAVRIVMPCFCKDMITKFGKPLIATSANISSQPFPRNFGEISSDILERVDYVAKVMQNDKNLNHPSVIVKLDGNGELIFLRE